MRENESIHPFIHPHLEMWEICKKKVRKKRKVQDKKKQKG
jgi:hypothetical protein